MKRIIKKIIFPFFNSERHDFLMKKWWFRLSIVIYIIGLFILFGVLSFEVADSYWGWCYDSAYLYFDNSTEYTQHLNQCGELLEQRRVEAILITILYTVIIHFIIQFIFFKIIINFIVLGGKKN